MHDESPTGLQSLLLQDLSGRAVGERARLDRDETRHARALRLEEGDAVALVDGHGTRRLGRLGPSSEREREVTLGELLPAPDPLPVELCVAVGNRTHALWLVEKAAELGIAGIQLLETERSASVADAGRSAGFRRKAERRALAAIKQSGGAWAPAIAAPVDLNAWLSAPGAPAGGVLLDPGGEPLAALLSGWDGRRAIRILVGPEGGLTEPERDACLEAGLRPARLGPTILRFETAAVAAVAVAWQRREMAGDGPPVRTSAGGAR
ncbi:MAG: RsmE family RNA methyltransferase [Gemmatimonadota bacterium]